MSTPPTAISILEGFDLRIGGRWVLQRASLSVRPGEVVVIMGPSGVGKSVLTDAVFGLLDEGRGFEASPVGGEVRERGCVVFQDSSGLPHLNVQQNLHLVAKDAAHLQEVLAHASLDPRAYPERLSGGERRRLAVQRALATGRSLLWFDEPAAGLDVVRAGELAQQIRQQAQERSKAIVIVEHQPSFVAAVADRVFWMLGDGRLQEPPLPEGAVCWSAGALREAFTHGVVAVDAERPEATTRRARKAFAWGILRPFRWASSMVYAFLWPFALTSRSWVLSARSVWVALMLTGLRGLPFYSVVAAIFAAIFLLVFELAVAFVDPSAVVARMGPQVVYRVAPVLACLLAAAQAGSSISAWLGSMQAQRQLDALRVLHAPVHRALVAPTWLGAWLGLLLSATVFAAAMLGVFGLYLWYYASDLLAVFEQQFRDLSWLRAGGRVALFSAVVASVAIDESLHVERRGESVARAVTSTITWGTIWVILSEALLLLWELR